MEPYRRITSTGQFIPEIDGLRFIAILSVFIFHVAVYISHHSSPAYSQALQSNWLFQATQVLEVGVPLFFVISGFVLSLPFAQAYRNVRKPVSLKKYFLRRLTRLEPPYFLCMLLCFLFKIAAAKGTALALVPNLIASLFYVHNFTYGTPSAINPVAWSLEIEVQFYILAPALASVFAITRTSVRRVVLVMLVFLACGASWFITYHSPVSFRVRLFLSLLTQAQYFLAGFLLTEFYLSGGDRRRQNWLWDLVSLVGWPLLVVGLMGGRSIWGAPPWLPWLTLLLYIAAFQSVIMNRFVTNAWIATIGGMCYSIYLLHAYISTGVGIVDTTGGGR